MSTVPVFAPDGSLGDIPAEHLVAAVKAGAKPGVTFKAPDGSMGVIPADRIQDAYKAGGKLVPIDQQETDHHGFWSQVVDAVKSGASAYGVEDGKIPLSGPEGEALAQRTSQQAARALPFMAGGGITAPVSPTVTPKLAETYRDATLNKVNIPEYAGEGPTEEELATSPNFRMPEVKEPVKGPPLKASDFAIQRPTETPAQPAPQSAEAPASEPPLKSGANLPKTLSGESALRQILTGQDNANLMKIAKSRGINVAQETQLKPGFADNRLINKIIDDFSPDELEGIRSQYAESNRFRHNFGDIGPEAWKTMSLQTYFPELKIPAAKIARTQAAITKAQPAPDADLSADLTEILQKSLEKVKVKPAQ